MARITRNKNEVKNTKVYIWKLNPEKDTTKKFYMPTPRQIKTRIRTKV